MRLFSDSTFMAAARCELKEQIDTCARDFIHLGELVAKVDVNGLDEHGQNLLNEISMGTGQIKALFENAQEMVGNIENFLNTREFPSSDEMKESIKNSGADASGLEDIDEYKLLMSDEEQEQFAFVACNYELISRMLDSAIELCAVLHKAAKKLYK